MKHPSYKLLYVLPILFVLFAGVMIYLEVDLASSLFMSFVFTCFVFVIFRYFILSNLEKMDENFETLKEEMHEAQEGTKLLVRRDLELNRANEKLQKFDEAKSDFISVVAHQLRTPLSGIRWTLHMLLNGDLGDLNNDQKTFLMKSYESNNRMITLVNDMLDADRIQAGKVKYNLTCINLVDLMDNVIFEISPQASKKGISIEFKSKLENLPEVCVDAETIRAVIQNLLENAIKYTMTSGKIYIDAQNKGEFLEVSIQDNGIGIPESQKKNVFEKFFRAKNAIKFETDGSGLGLNISKTIVEKNGGKIWFESEENKGTTFYFTLPLWTGDKPKPEIKK